MLNGTEQHQTPGVRDAAAADQERAPCITGTPRPGMRTNTPARSSRPRHRKSQATADGIPFPGARCKQRGMTGQMSSAFASAMGGHVMAQARGWSVTKTAAHVVATVTTALLLASGKQALWQLVSRLLPALPSEPVEVGSRPLVRSALVSVPSLVPSVARPVARACADPLGASQPAPKAHRQQWPPRHSPLCAARWSRHRVREPLRRTSMHNDLAPARARTQEQAADSCRRGGGRHVVQN